MPRPQSSAMPDGRCRAGAIRPPSRSRLLGLVLAQGGSAPGWDGIPYEVLVQGAHFVAELLYQAFEAAGQSAAALRQAIGAAIDLLVWIPKVEGNLAVGGAAATATPHVPPASFRGSTSARDGPHGGGGPLPAPGGHLRGILRA